MKALEPIQEATNALIEHAPAFNQVKEELSFYTVEPVEDILQEGTLVMSKVIAHIIQYKERAVGAVEEALAYKGLWDELHLRVSSVIRRAQARAYLSRHMKGLGSGDLREAKVQMLLAPALNLRDDIELCRLQAKEFSDFTERTLSRLDDAYKKVSRQITAIQIAHNLGEIERGDLPYAGKLVTIGDKRPDEEEEYE